MKSKILYAKHAIDEDGNELLKEVFYKQFEENRTPWMKKLREYLETLEIYIRAVRTTKMELLKKQINKWDAEMWKSEIENKSTLSLYKLYKNNIEEISWYDNTE